MACLLSMVFNIHNCKIQLYKFTHNLEVCVWFDLLLQRLWSNQVHSNEQWPCSWKFSTENKNCVTFKWSFKKNIHNNPRAHCSNWKRRVQRCATNVHIAPNSNDRNANIAQWFTIKLHLKWNCQLTRTLNRNLSRRYSTAHRDRFYDNYCLI